MAIEKSISKHMRRPDEAILDDIWRSLWMEETIRSIDIHDISVEVENGQVCFSGHVSKDYNNQRIEEITRSIAGVAAVYNHLVADHDLSIRVARALCSFEPTRLLTLPVYSFHGWVELGGSVPNREIQRGAEATAARVPAVRGVIMLPDIAGEHGGSVRTAVQPRIGVGVFGKDETQGTVYQVVISPQNRLVTHTIVRIKRSTNGWQESFDFLIPVDEMDVVDEGGIFMNSGAPAIHQFPGFISADYPYAPLTWQPPYPYAVGRVRWPRQEKVNSEPRSTERFISE